MIAKPEEKRLLGVFLQIVCCWLGSSDSRHQIYPHWGNNKRNKKKSLSKANFTRVGRKRTQNGTTVKVTGVKRELLFQSWNRLTTSSRIFYIYVSNHCWDERDADVRCIWSAWPQHDLWCVIPLPVPPHPTDRHLSGACQAAKEWSPKHSCIGGKSHCFPKCVRTTPSGLPVLFQSWCWVGERNRKPSWCDLEETDESRQCFFGVGGAVMEASRPCTMGYCMCIPCLYSGYAALNQGTDIYGSVLVIEAGQQAASDFYLTCCELNSFCPRFVHWQNIDSNTNVQKLGKPRTMVLSLNHNDTLVVLSFHVALCGT